MMKLKKRERQKRILEEVRNNVTVRISVIADMFNVTTETVRRDLKELSQRGLLDRTYGGASGSLTREAAINVREILMVDERTQIAEMATSLIEQNDVLMIDSGATNVHFARQLSRIDYQLNVITNCVSVASILSEKRRMRVILCPGEFNSKENSVFGMEAHHFLNRFHSNKTIISAAGITKRGITDVNSEACWIKRKMIERADMTILLLDHGKFHKSAMEVICPLEEIDNFITNTRPDDPLREALEKGGVKIHVAGE